MVLWLVLFILVVAISFILAFLSMRDYQEIPQKSKIEYGLFLIRQPNFLNSELLASIHENLSKAGLIVSFERLFKGQKSALVVFGPKKILQEYFLKLDLLELEDYATSLDSTKVTVWEVGFKLKADEQKINPFENLPTLAEDEQFWWQVIIKPKIAKKDLAKFFQTQIRVAFFCEDPKRKTDLTKALQNLASGQLIKIPQPFSSHSMLTFYQLRSMDNQTNLPLTLEDITALLKLNLS